MSWHSKPVRLSWGYRHQSRLTHHHQSRQLP